MLKEEQKYRIKENTDFRPLVWEKLMQDVVRRHRPGRIECCTHETFLKGTLVVYCNTSTMSDKTQARKSETYLPNPENLSLCFGMAHTKVIFFAKRNILLLIFTLRYFI